MSSIAEKFSRPHLLIIARVFVHGHTYQCHPASCAAALEVQRIVQEEDLVQNAAAMGQLLSRLLTEKLSGHPNVGDIRGRGLFWGIEFVADKQTKAPFPPWDHVVMKICEEALLERYSINVYPATGATEDGLQADSIIISPPYNVTAEDIELIVSTLVRLIHDFFSD